MVMVMVIVVCDVCKMPTTEDRGIRSVVDGSGRSRRINERELVGNDCGRKLDDTLERTTRCSRPKKGGLLNDHV